MKFDFLTVVVVKIEGTVSSIEIKRVKKVCFIFFHLKLLAGKFYNFSSYFAPFSLTELETTDLPDGRSFR